MERQSRAALKKLLSCTLQQAEDFDAAAETTQAVMESAAADGAGLIQDDKLQDYLIEQFSDSMTGACIEELAMNRTFYQSIALVKQFNSAIEVSEIELVQCAGEQKDYSFSAELKTSAGGFVDLAMTCINSVTEQSQKWTLKKIDIIRTIAYNRNVKKVKETKRLFFERVTMHGSSKDFQQRADYHSRLSAKCAEAESRG
ncbi:MAG: hypothetical protein HFH13_10035 [Dorea sp.]|nr:hypothetical protein [Dorea sp.]